MAFRHARYRSPGQGTHGRYAVGVRVTPPALRAAAAALAACTVVVATGCGGDTTSLTGHVGVAGSTTLLPLMARATSEFAAAHPLARVDVNMTGTTDGITLLCDRLADVAGASRPMTVRELRGCATGGVHPVQVLIGHDALVLFAATGGTAPTCMALGDINARFGAAAAGRSGAVVVPNASSGTRAMFIEKVLAPFAAQSGTDPAMRRDAHVVATDQLMLAEVLRLPGAVGMAGWQTVQPWLGKVRAIGVNAGDGCVVPSATTIADGTYPLTRDLLLYANPDAGTDTDTVVAYMDLVTSPDFLEGAGTGLSANGIDAAEHDWATRQPAAAAQ